MNYEDLKWINQSLYSNMDKSFDSHGYLDISVSISTSDDLTFSQPKLVFNLENQGQRRNVRLSINNTIDLVDSFNEITKQFQQIYVEKTEGQIYKRYNKDKDFVFTFKEFNGNQLVVLQIIHNNSDAGKIIFPLKPEFVTIGKVLRMFEQNYVKFGMDLPNRYLASLSAGRLVGIQNAIKILPSQLVPIQPDIYQDARELELIKQHNPNLEQFIYNGLECSICGEPQYETPSGATCKNRHGGADGIDPREQIDEFEKFAAEEEPKVRIPELESETIVPKEPIIQEFNSPFITHTLKNNILNLEQMLFALFTNNNPLTTIMNSIHNGQAYTLLPGITEQDLKSALYVSNLYFNLHLQSYVQNQTGFPNAIPVVKYQTNDVDRETIELSYDLMMISAYLKLYRNRMEAINSDPYTNGALVHFSFRCFLDIATYSYLNGKNNEVIKNTIVSRFKFFRESGFFDHYDKNLVSEKQQPIYENEISEFIEKVFNNVVDSENIDIRHFNAHDNGSVKLPPKNNFSLEQITNDIVKYEIKTMFGQRIEDLTRDEEIILFFNTKTKKKYKPTDHRPEPRKVETHILRYIKLKSNELPENIREDFIKYIEDLGDDKYDFIDSPYKIEELNEVIVQALYISNNSIGENLKYTQFASRVESCIPKEYLLAKIKETDEPEKEEGDWSNAFANIEL